nr:MAG TPA: hypothetical protein [Caudoviricetes sp.]
MKKMVLGLLIALGVAMVLYATYSAGVQVGQNEVIKQQEIYQENGKMYSNFNGQINLYR